MYKYLFGPVPSRRLGMSLGIDLVPHKVCSLNCIYCECGPTTKLTTQRNEYVPYNEVIRELKQFFSGKPSLDYITFSGSGEPTLNSRIGDVLTFIKQNYPDIPVAVLTNGTLLKDKQVRSEILNADVVLPSLDVASCRSFKKMNMPFHSVKIDDYINGLIKFRKEYKGKIWLESLIIPGYNNSKQELKQLKEAFIKIKPDKIQLNTLDRPGVLPGLKAASKEELEQIKEFLKLDNVEIIAAAESRKDVKSYRDDIESAILETIFRRPCTVEDLAKILGLHENEINKYLDVLETDKKITSVEQDRGVFYQTTNT